MASRRVTPISEECITIINYLIAYQLHSSDAYLQTVCHYFDEKTMPPFVIFLEEEAERKREQAKCCLRFLQKHGGTVYLPDIKQPDIDNWESAIQTLTYAVQMESILYNILEDLKRSASKSRIIRLLPLPTNFLDKQKRIIEYLEEQVSLQNVLKERKQEENLSEMTCETSASGEKT